MAFPSRIAAAIRTGMAPLHGAKPPDALRAGQVGQRASGNERGKSACGLVQGHRALRSMAARPCGTERVLQKLPLRLPPLLIVTRMGRDYRPGPRQRIEQVARQGSGRKFEAVALELGFQSPL